MKRFICSDAGFPSTGLIVSHTQPERPRKGLVGEVATFILALACASASAQSVASGPQKTKPRIARDPKDFVAAWPIVPKPQSGAPNIVLILVDDVGFSTTSTFGGPIPTPAFDKLAERGLRYNAYPESSISSASRAS